MDTLNAIRSRRAIKHYDSSHQMMSEEVEQLVDLAI
jgi:nitroreductase